MLCILLKSCIGNKRETTNHNLILSLLTVVVTVFKTSPAVVVAVPSLSIAFAILPSQIKDLQCLVKLWLVVGLYHTL